MVFSYLRSAIMKKILLQFSFLLFLIQVVNAQDTSQVSGKTPFFSGKGFQVYANLNFCNWMGQPDSIKSKFFSSRGGEVFLRHNFNFGKSRFGIAPGIGFSSYNISSNGTVDTIGDTTVFRITAGTYKRNKFVANYMEVPIEFFFQSKDKNPLRIGLGFKAGYMLSSHIKYRASGDKVKDYGLPNTMNYRYGLTFQITYAWFGLNAYYSLTPLFEKNKGPDFVPYSFGITIAPY